MIYSKVEMLGKLLLEQVDTGVESASSWTSRLVYDPHDGGDVLFSNGTDWISCVFHDGVPGAQAIIIRGLASEGFVPGDVGKAVFYSSINSRWEYANGNNSSKLAIGILSTVVDSDDFWVTLAGQIENLSGLTPGKFYVPNTVGVLIDASGVTAFTYDYENIIFQAESATIGNVLPWRTRNRIISGGSFASKYQTDTSLFETRRGLDSARVSYVLAEGEFAFSTDTKQLYIGDGVTVGGLLVNRQIDWRESVLSITNTQPGSPSVGQRYLIGTSPTGVDWTGHANNTTQYTGTGWVFEPPTNGACVYVETPGKVYIYTGANWVDMGSLFSYYHNDLLGLDGGTPAQYYHMKLLTWQVVTGSDCTVVVQDASAYHNHSSLYTKDHNSLTGLDGGTPGQYYHLTSAEWTALRSGGSSDASSYHIHSNLAYAYLSSGSELHVNTGHTGIYTTIQALDAIAAWKHVIHFQNSDNIAQPGYSAQIYAYYNDGSNIYYRSSNGTTWNTWTKFSMDGHTHAHNDTTSKQGSGPDYYHLTSAQLSGLITGSGSSPYLAMFDGGQTISDAYENGAGLSYRTTGTTWASGSERGINFCDADNYILHHHSGQLSIRGYNGVAVLVPATGDALRIDGTTVLQSTNSCSLSLNNWFYNPAPLHQGYYPHGSITSANVSTVYGTNVFNLNAWEGIWPVSEGDGGNGGLICHISLQGSPTVGGNISLFQRAIRYQPYGFVSTTVGYVLGATSTNGTVGWIAGGGGGGGDISYTALDSVVNPFKIPLWRETSTTKLLANNMINFYTSGWSYGQYNIASTRDCDGRFAPVSHNHDGTYLKVATEWNGSMSAKTTLSDADLFLIEDSLTSYSKKKVAFSDLASNFASVSSVLPVSVFWWKNDSIAWGGDWSYTLNFALTALKNQCGISIGSSPDTVTLPTGTYLMETFVYFFKNLANNFDTLYARLNSFTTTDHAYFGVAIIDPLWGTNGFVSLCGASKITNTDCYDTKLHQLLEIYAKGTGNDIGVEVTFKFTKLS
jgi:hypothetical protein